MPTIIGNLEADNRLRVTRLRGKDFPEQGYIVSFEQIPPTGVSWPEPKPGINHIMYWNPEEPDSKIWFEEKERELTHEEKMQVELPEIKGRLKNLEKASGAGGQQGERGIAQRLDEIEDKIARLEEKS